LRRSKQGADWLILRWAGLDDDLRTQGHWDDDQRRLAHDLLGAPLELRKGTFYIPEANDVEGLSALVASQIERLRDDQEAVLLEQDEAERGMALAGMALYEDATTARLRRQESRFYRAYTKARADLLRGRETNASTRSSKPISHMQAIPVSGISYHVNRMSDEVALWPELDRGSVRQETEQEAKTETETKPKTETEPKASATASETKPVVDESKPVSTAKTTTKATVATPVPIVNVPSFKNRKARRAEAKLERERAAREAAAARRRGC
jgi:hypothetical protein